MRYDPVKDRLRAVFTRWPWLHQVFFSLLHLVFLRSWYVRREIRNLLADGRPQTAIENGAKILDAGSGFGQYTHFLVQNFSGVYVTAVDLKTDYLEDCRRLFQALDLAHRVEWREADLTDANAYPFDQGERFDFILSVDVMEHIEDDEVVFRNFASALTPGGHALINTPSTMGGSGVTHEEDAGFIDEHARDGYDPEALREKLRAAGLDPVQTIFTYGPFGSLAWQLLLKIPMQLLNIHWSLAPLVALYYLPVLPLGLLLNAIDLAWENSRGTGLLVIARKPAASE